MLIELSKAIRDLARFRPYSTSPQAAAFGDAIDRLKNVEAVLLTIEEFRPMILSTLEAGALEELQIEHEDPTPEVTALVARYCRKREPLR